jgi:ubiquinone/menaquinone biosynthesis C-methylase UbiE
MKSIEQSVSQHYTHGSLADTILQALTTAGKDINRLEPADLAPVDEFHIGGRQATIDFAEQMGLTPGMQLLDIGCGLGGASRYFAHERGCQVTGIDVTAEYVTVAETLAQRVGLAGRVSYHLGSGLSLPFAAGSFDAAYMLHVGMNIAEKAVLFAEIRRVLRPRSIFGIYDVMREAEGELTFPVPWAATVEMSFVDRAGTYRRLLQSCGFAIEEERSRRDFAIGFFRKMREQVAQSGPPPLGLHILMGPTAQQKVTNMIANLERGLIAPTEIICRAV